MRGRIVKPEFKRDPSTWPVKQTEDPLSSEVTEALIDLVVARRAPGHNPDSFRTKLLRSQVRPQNFGKHTVVGRDEHLVADVPADVVYLNHGMRGVRVCGAALLDDVSKSCEDSAIVRQVAPNGTFRLWLLLHDQVVIRFAE